MVYGSPPDPPGKKTKHQHWRGVWVIYVWNGLWNGVLRESLGRQWVYDARSESEMNSTLYPCPYLHAVKDVSHCVKGKPIVCTHRRKGHAEAAFNALEPLAEAGTFEYRPACV